MDGKGGVENCAYFVVIISVNLVVSAVGSCTKAVDLFGNLEKLLSFTGKSKRRVHLYEKHQEKRYPQPGYGLKRLKRVETNVGYHTSYALQTVLRTFDAVLNTLEELHNENDSSDYKAKAQAGAFISYFTNDRFVLTTRVFFFKSWTVKIHSQKICNQAT